ncbi:hypothetical protein Dip510_001765 [Elusimicrobium posterum]|uniref:hypothetical protein n=1 Tax=Elusimicrobium posterum TaxID=3116653 RepID=UPI003C725069
MAFVIKGGGPSLKSMDKKTAYTWGASALVFLFVLMAMFSAMGKEEVKEDQFVGLNSRGMIDLAQMPFANEEAAKEISARYRDIAENPVAEAERLYSEEEKNARIEEDEELGLPVPPDAEYAAAEREIQAKQSYSRPTTPRAPTQINQMQKGGGFQSSGGGKGGSSFSNPGASTSSSKGTGKINTTASALNQLKNDKSGLREAYAMTNAASKKGGEDAAQGAIDAFQGGKSEADLNTDMEKAMTELNADSMPSLDKKSADLPSSNALTDKGKDLNDKASDAADAKDAASGGCGGYWYCIFTDAISAGLKVGAEKGTEMGLNTLIGQRQSCIRSVKKGKSTLDEIDCYKYNK